ncbi:MAG: putative lipid II flippase FtsW [Bacilli bacterium]|nr:putative lipid II flippase FtsW [Bacilli bacterium]
MKKKFDIFLFVAIIVLSIFGLMMIYSASSIWAEYKFNDSFYYMKRQLIFIVIGIFLMLFISKIDYSIYYKKANTILGICFILLILVLIPGIGSVRNGSRSWFGIGSLGIQPSEAAKLSLIIFTSKYLSKSTKFLKSYKEGVFPILGVVLLFFGLIMLQPDLGTGMIIVVSIISLLFIAGVNMKFFIGGGILGIIGVIILIVIAPYRMDRITSFIDPWKDPLGTGFQIIQSLYAIGPGGLLGTGYLNSIQKQFYLPEPQTDFIFSIVAEEFGILGAIFVSGIFLFIIYRGLKISLKCNDSFAKYLSFGMIFQLAFQTAMNLMVVIGMIPVTGVTLPFLSYGGSSLLITMVSMGIILNISRYQK